MLQSRQRVLAVERRCSMKSLVQQEDTQSLLSGRNTGFCSGLLKILLVWSRGGAGSSGEPDRTHQRR